VSWFDSIRFANWMHNGMGSGDTETGAYTLMGGTPQPANAFIITRNPGARWWLPSEDEWYKAAYHKNDGATGNYWDYPTSTNATPYSDQPPGAGAPDSSNTANFFEIDDSIVNGYNDGWAVTASNSFVVDSLQNYLTDVGAYTSSRSPYGTFDQGGNVFEWNETLPFGGLNRGVRGGSWFDSYSFLHAADRFSGDFPGNEYFRLGFRVASIPEPASITLGIGSIMIFMLKPWGKRY
jgi:formylglycine-generating enzyme required for sulfatase activity